MKKFIRAVAVAKTQVANLYYNHNYLLWFSTKETLTTKGIELVYTFKKPLDYDTCI